MKILERGQITIPKKMREQYGITKDTELTFIPVQEGILLVKSDLKKSPLHEVYGILHKKGSTDSYIDDLRGR